MAKSKGDYQCGQAYVAFSHVKQLSGLHIVKYTLEQMKADECISQFRKSNRARQIPHVQPALTQNPNSGIAVIHQNVQGLPPYKKDVDGHTALTAAYIICLSETHLQQRSPWPLKSVAAMNFHIEQSKRTVTSGGGIAIWIQKTLGQIESVETVHTGIELVHVKYS